MSQSIRSLRLRRLRLPLVTPYRLSYRTFEEFEPIVVEVIDDRGHLAFGEGHISPGSSRETRDGGWAFARAAATRIIGLESASAREWLESRIAESPVAASALISALEMLEGSPLLHLDTPIRLPLLAPVNGLEQATIQDEIASKLALGFGTFKVKVGQDVDADLRRLEMIQRAVDGQASLRIDANRAYDRAAAIRFSTQLDPDGVELFEQPCAAEDWDANAEVASRSRVPLMLDEPICTHADIDRAADIEGVGFCKLKLKRFGGLRRLHEALVRVRDRGMRPVLGDGLACEISGWMEACVALHTIDNAGEFNGYLKPTVRVFEPPLGFEDGALTMPAAYRPTLDADTLAAQTIELISYGET